MSFWLHSLDVITYFRDAVLAFFWCLLWVFLLEISGFYTNWTNWTGVWRVFGMPEECRWSTGTQCSSSPGARILPEMESAVSRGPKQHLAAKWSSSRCHQPCWSFLWLLFLAGAGVAVWLEHRVNLQIWSFSVALYVLCVHMAEWFNLPCALLCFCSKHLLRASQREGMCALYQAVPRAWWNWSGTKICAKGRSMWLHTGGWLPAAPGILSVSLTSCCHKHFLHFLSG